MAERPNEQLRFATNTFPEITDLGTGDGLQSYDNKFAPPSQMQADGFLVRETPYRPIINFLFNNIFRYIAHLDERYVVGDMHQTKTAESAAQISTRLGGTWVARGTDTLGTENVNVFEKTV